MTSEARSSAGASAVAVLIVSGPVGVGKSSVAEEIFDQLAARDIPHAVVDLDDLVCAGHMQGETLTTTGWR